MKFQSKTQKEIDEEKLLPEGEYGFVISDAKEKVSKAGNEMIELTVRVYKPDGKFVLINDYLMEKMLYKILHCSEACGLLERYNSGELQADEFIGKEGYAKIKTQKSTDPNYSDKSVISDYVVPKAGEAKTFIPPKDNLNKALDGDELEDDIPF